MPNTSKRSEAGPTSAKRSVKTTRVATPAPTSAPKPPLTLEDLTWGDRLHLAYRRSRALYGHTYREVAERISQLTLVVDSTLIRLETYKEPPSQERVRRIAFYALLAYGFKPEEFGLTEQNVGLNPQVAKLARSLLIPLSPCFTGTAA